MAENLTPTNGICQHCGSGALYNIPERYLEDDAPNPDTHKFDRVKIIQFNSIALRCAVFVWPDIQPLPDAWASAGAGLRAGGVSIAMFTI